MTQTKLNDQTSDWQQGHLPLAATAVVDATAASIEERGAVFTRPEVVNFLLDLTGYRADRPLDQLRLLEPSIGQGNFLLPAIDRLLAAWQVGPNCRDTTVLQNALRGVELHQDTFAHTRSLVIDRLIQHSLRATQATQLADAWLIAGDFLLAELPGRFHVVIGNPPYVRQERIPDALMAEYRARYHISPHGLLQRGGRHDGDCPTATPGPAGRCGQNLAPERLTLRRPHCARERRCGPRRLPAPRVPQPARPGGRAHRGLGARRQAPGPVGPDRSVMG